jgi:hypothetical protein
MLLLRLVAVVVRLRLLLPMRLLRLPCLSCVCCHLSCCRCSLSGYGFGCLCGRHFFDLRDRYSAVQLFKLGRIQLLMVLRQ